MHRIGLGFIVTVYALVLPVVGFAQRAPDLRRPAGKEWLTIGGDWRNTRYSTLTQINRNNVKNLKGAWVTHLGSGLGQKYSFEGTPIVKDGILYIGFGDGGSGGDPMGNGQSKNTWLAKILRIGRTRANLALDLLNALNLSTILIPNQAFIPNGAWLTPTGTQTPVMTARTAKITVQYDF